MFWRFGGYANISTVDTLLDKPDVTLEELLDESELIQELKQHNTKLIEYLREDNVLKRLMDYVIAPSLVDEDEEDEDEEGKKKKKERPSLTEGMDPEDVEKAEKARLKYAYVACEILSSETWSIVESMMLNEAYLRDFWGFVRRPAPLDSLQASYFTRVNETLFDKKTEEMLEFFKSLEGVVPAMLQHVDNPMVMDLLLKIISLERAEGGQGIVDWLKQQDLIPILLSFLSSEHPASVQTSAGDFLKAIITISANATQNEQSCIGPNSLTRQLVSAPCIETLISAMLQGGNPLTVGVGIVIEVIRKNNSDYDPENVGGPDSPPTTYDPIYLGTLLRLFAKHVPDFMALILSSKHAVNEGGQKRLVERGQLNLAWGTKIEPLGFDRFKTCELMAELLHCSNMGLLNEAGSEEYVRQRDEERERLRQQGAFNPRREDESGIDHTDTTVDFANGSALAPGSPEDLRILEITNTSEEDGFEDVSSSGVLVDGVKDIEEKSDHEKETKNEPFTNIPSEASKLDDSTELVEEPFTEHNHEVSKTGGQPQPQTQEPVSPTASGLTEKVGEIKIEGEKPTAEATHPGQATSIDAKSDKPPTDNVPQEQPSESPRSLSPHPEDTPAPLFSGKTQAEHPDSQPSAAGEPGNTSASSVTENTQIPAQPRGSIDESEEQARSQIQYDPDGKPVVGDYLKIMFVENKVVPTILGFFFRFPWNNFLHNVVYDIVQQVFNGSMERGFNRALAIDLFATGRITEQIVEGQRRSDESEATKKMRLGYMGHLTLIAEEVVKFSERYPPELLSRTVMDKVLNQEWIEYVERTLSETRERDNAILGGVRPDVTIGHRQAVLNAVGGFTGSSALANAGLNGGIGGSTFEGFDIMNSGSASSGVFGLGGGSSSLLSGFGSSSDDDEDEDMEDQDDDDRKNSNENSGEGDSENTSSNSSSQPIPIIAPPPVPLNLGPSRARRQLAARLAAQKQQAAEAAAADGNETDRQANSDKNNDNQSHSNPFVLDDDNDRDSPASAAFPSHDFSSRSKDEPLMSSPTFPSSGFTPPGSPSTNSSDDDDEGTAEAVRRKVRIPLEVDDDDDDMGEMVGPGTSTGSGLTDSDDEDEAIINESLGYSNFFGPSRYGLGGRSRILGSHFDDDDDDEQNDSSDGEEDDGLVEILVPGRKSSASH
ncbi:hypothetical protein VTN00DRAFT_10249 [Thermoascus crustaceus]|uniref:uncharacterized protein n=1 Tax=Thermoascus crustaceus TaxID=5088 RepID=UPI003742CD48